jgi:hypothetical protein
VLVLLGGVFRRDLAVWRDEPVSGSHSLTVKVVDFPLQSANLGEL